MKLDPSRHDASFELGKVYLSLGDAAQAKKVLTDLLVRKPDYAKRSEVERILSTL